MPEFMIEVPHSAEECFAAVSEALRHPDASGLIATTYWGCAAGVHTAWIVHRLADVSEARALVPRLLSDTARVVELTRLSLSEVQVGIVEEGSKG